MNVASFDALHNALQSIIAPTQASGIDVRLHGMILLLRLPSDVAAFAVCNGRPRDEFTTAYSAFKELYHSNHVEWDTLTLSFVLCRSTERADEDTFYAEVEHDPFFCRKYVVRAFSDTSQQRRELLRLPFLPLPDEDGVSGTQRPQPAQDFLRTAGLTTQLARHLVESGVRSADRIADDIVSGKASFPPTLAQPVKERIVLAQPKACSRLTSVTLDGFRAYKGTFTFDLDASIVVLYGPNGLGKTSLFDALDFCCTGRIERLCRHQKRTVTDFANVATHLDKTPGTGSVTLSGKTLATDGTEATWELKRGTGNWSAAWLDGIETTRKDVLACLTQANWPDAKMRQGNLESLFRATHLFGQDDQELLTEFRKGSVIPESFVSEMLALQDYTDGLSKVEKLATALTARRKARSAEVGAMREQLSALNETKAQLVAGMVTVSQDVAVGDLLAAIQQQLHARGLSDCDVPSDVSASAVIQWRDVVDATHIALDSQLAQVRALQERMPMYNRLQNEVAASLALRADAQASRDTELARKEDAQSLVDQHRLAIREGMSRLAVLSSQSEDVARAATAMEQCELLDRQRVPLESERAAQRLERDSLQTRLDHTEPAISASTRQLAEISQSLGSHRMLSDTLRTAVSSHPTYSGDQEALALAEVQLIEANERLVLAERQSALCDVHARDVRMSRDSYQGEFDRALATGNNLQSLLVELQEHLTGDICPLCGTAFVTNEALLARVRQQQSASVISQEVVARYQGLQAEEHEAERLATAAKERVLAARVEATSIKDRISAIEVRSAEYEQRITPLIGTSVMQQNIGAALAAQLQAASSMVVRLEAEVAAGAAGVATLQQVKANAEAARRSVDARLAELDTAIQRLNKERQTHSAVVSRVFERESVTTEDLQRRIADVQNAKEVAKNDVSDHEATCSEEQRTLDALTREVAAQTEVIERITRDVETRLPSIDETEQVLRVLGVPLVTPDDAVSALKGQLDEQAVTLAEVSAQAQRIVALLQAREARTRLSAVEEEIARMTTKIAEGESVLRVTVLGEKGCATLEKMMKLERQAAIERHIAAYGPLITNIQQRLRSVYGFGGVRLQASGGEAVVQVEWRNKSVQVAPTDFFSDSQKQILMLSIFLAGGLRQNWSGFAPVLLDDPVTHFDDLNAYGFVELVRGIIATRPDSWQFVISTCEERLFELMQRKFARVSGGALFYEFLGMSEDGPIIRPRPSDVKRREQRSKTPAN